MTPLTLRLVHIVHEPACSPIAKRSGEWTRWFRFRASEMAQAGHRRTAPPIASDSQGTVGDRQLGQKIGSAALRTRRAPPDVQPMSRGEDVLIGHLAWNIERRTLVKLVLRPVRVAAPV